MEQGHSAGAELAKLHVLLVDDSQINQLFVSSLAEDLGISLDCANNGAEALQRLREDNRRYQLVLMDLQMPVLDGLGATRAIREELKLKLPIIALTASAEPDHQESCRLAGMNGFLRKPVDGEALLRLIDHYRARGRAGEEYGKLKLDTLKLLHRASATRLRSTLQEAIDTCRQDFDQACQQWRQGDSEAAARLIHRYRGSLGTFAYEGFVRLTLDLEHAVRQGDENLEPRLDVFRAELDELLCQLQQWMESHEN
ncbi:response regulator [Chromobacterium vaccinii]|uniref:Response regulator n=1 Tax=Chromobacterium vaccinii TaxID=1108595 RepID=A0ABV0FHD9_9NEIS